MIFLIGRGRDRIDAGGIGAALVFGNQRRRRHLRDHEAGIEPRQRGEERGQAGQRRIDQHGDPPLGNRADFTQRQRDHISSESHRLGMEIAARERLVGIGEDQRIVRNAIRLDSQRGRCLPQQIEHRAHHLRLAAQAIGILHTVVSCQMRSADRGSLHQGAQRRSRLDLPPVAAQRMDTRIERCIGALRGFGGKRAGQQCRSEQQFRLEQSGERISAGELRAVQQRQPFLRPKRQRDEAGLRQSLRRGQPRLARPDLAGPDHRRGHMCERC